MLRVASSRNSRADRLAPRAFVTAGADPAQPIGRWRAGLGGGEFFQLRRAAGVSEIGHLDNVRRRGRAYFGPDFAKTHTGRLGTVADGIHVADDVTHKANFAWELELFYYAAARARAMRYSYP